MAIMCQIKLVIFYVQIVCLFTNCLSQSTFNQVKQDKCTRCRTKENSLENKSYCWSNCFLFPRQLRPRPDKEKCDKLCRTIDNYLENEDYCFDNCVILLNQAPHRLKKRNSNIESNSNDLKANTNSQGASNKSNVNITNKKQLVKRSNNLQNNQQPMSESEYMTMKNSGFGGRDETFPDFNNQQPMSEAEYMAMKNSGFGGRDETFPDFNGDDQMSEAEYMNMKNSGFGGRDETFPDFSPNNANERTNSKTKRSHSRRNALLANPSRESDNQSGVSNNDANNENTGSNQIISNEPMSEAEYMNMKNSGFGGRDETFPDFNGDVNDQNQMSESEYMNMKNSGFGGRDETFPDFNSDGNDQNQMSESEYLAMKNSGFGGRDETFPDFNGNDQMSESEYMNMKNSGFGGRDETFPDFNNPNSDAQVSDLNGKGESFVDPGSNSLLKQRPIKNSNYRKRNQPDTPMSESEYMAMKNSGFGGRDETFADFNNYQYDYQDTNMPKNQVKKRSKFSFRMPKFLGKQQALGQQAYPFEENNVPRYPVNMPAYPSKPVFKKRGVSNQFRMKSDQGFPNNNYDSSLNMASDKRAVRNSFFDTNSSRMFVITGVVLFMVGALLTALFWFISKPKIDASKHSKKKRKSATDTENLIS